MSGLEDRQSPAGSRHAACFSVQVSKTADEPGTGEVDFDVALSRAIAGFRGLPDRLPEVSPAAQILYSDARQRAAQVCTDLLRIATALRGSRPL
jgi:hypothetical protein